MNELMCLKYILFLEERSQQVSVDGKISVQEIYQLQIELERFIAKVVKSDLPTSIKKQTKQLTIAYSARPESEQKGMLSRWDFFKNRRERKMKEAVRGFLTQLAEFKKYFYEKVTLN
jgi:hypothetical protein